MIFFWLFLSWFFAGMCGAALKEKRWIALFFCGWASVFMFTTALLERIG